jgi:deoxyribodipyrimidine photo-lyase
VDVQGGGEHEAEETLRSFLYMRGANYQRAMSSPITAWDACSRLSPHLAWGTISLRRVYQAMLQRQEGLRMMDVKERAELSGPWLKAMVSFGSRLHWRSHFMQKLEDEPRIEFENFNMAYDGLRENEFNRDYFDAWCAGLTGYPLVDACMRAVCVTGYLNFRMRSLLVSFASYDLWLHWRETGIFLTRQWLDYEPGIHYSQMQMQSGTTGINTVRIYDPTKQAQDQDPDGLFIRQWVPALANVPQAYIHMPWLMPVEVQRKAGCILGDDYPMPLVDHKLAAKKAQVRIAALRKQDTTREAARAVLLKHGSRKDTTRRMKLLRESGMQQLTLDLPDEASKT